ncbi:uncharacterized protein A4U43_C05F31740 [Asparagus officinalis]|uniref:Uncharacterized protein n=1 Tax=Asparagus officinalis TaxID=4686 RepID=A0A5P1EWL8_ASPOF|nr:uncharacterized protein A4U43_C05F31740 [Asparagus officinalis]
MTYFNTSTTKETLDKLEAKYGKKSDSHVNNLWKKLTRAQCEEGIDVRKHVNDMVAIADELIFHGRVLDVKIIVSTIINSLPSSDKYIEDYYTLAESNWTVKHLINKIDHQEDRKAVTKVDDVAQSNPSASNVMFTPKIIKASRRKGRSLDIKVIIRFVINRNLINKLK